MVSAMSALLLRESWLSRLLARAGLIEVGSHVAGTDFGSEVAVEPGYSPLQAMSAFAAFPWVKACVTAKAVDLSGLPLRAVRGQGIDAEKLPDHEVLDLLRQPSERVTGLAFRRQLWVDLDLTGNWYGLMLGGPKPLSVLRMHPARVKVRGASDGQIADYEYDGRGIITRYPWDAVLHIAGPSWEDDPKGLFGTGLIRALHNDLTADLAAQKSSAKSANKGRPDAIVRPKDGSDRWTKIQVDAVTSTIQAKLDAATGGVLVLGGAAEYSPLSWSPKDMDFAALRIHVREAVLAASGVPPSRVSLPTANYAQAREMERTYWQSLQGESALIDDTLTRLARMWDPSVRVFHDFSAVPALQADRSQQVARVQQWWTMGLSLADAAAYEGFEDLPEPEALLPRPVSSEPSGESASVPTTQTLRSWWHRAPFEVESDEDTDPRGIVWRRFIDRIHAPVERGFNLEMRRYFMEQAAGIAERLEVTLGQAASGPDPVTRDLSGAAWEFILNLAAEAEKLGELVSPHFRLALQQAFAAAGEELGLTDLDSFGLRNAEATLRADMITRVSETTKDVVSDVIRSGLATGASVNEMQASIMRARAFSPARALTIARTETTRAVNRGTIENYQQAAVDLPELKVQWLSARDSAVRESHRAMDGEVAEVGARFVNPESGRKATQPGGFQIAEEDINCRCTVIPVLGA